MSYPRAMKIIAIMAVAMPIRLIRLSFSLNIKKPISDEMVTTLIFKRGINTETSMTARPFKR